MMGTYLTSRSIQTDTTYWFLLLCRMPLTYLAFSEVKSQGKSLEEQSYPQYPVQPTV